MSDRRLDSPQVDSPQLDSPRLEDLTPEEANRIIHSHRKVRYGTACWPCRQRKVKCDNRGPDQPCENCVRREHPQLCSYKPNRTPSTKHGHGSVDSVAGLVKKRAHSPDGDDTSHGSDPRREASLGTYVESETAEVSRYLGQNSIPALLKEQSSPNAPQEDGVDYIRQDMRSILGLDNSAPFPLMSPRHLDRLTSDISSELPSDREVMKLFRTYKEIPQPFWGFVIDIDELESRLMIYLEDRAKNAKASTRTTKPVSASWLSILFAILAVGSQYHDSPYHVRTRDSQQYIQISFHFLRLGNFLLRPNFDSIQALLMTSFVLLNDMKAEASWALLGLTCRLAQSLGLHRSNPIDGRASPEILKKEMVRRKLWWTCLWHDTLTSLSFDRSNMTNIPCCPIPLSPRADSEGFAYLEAMYHLCQIINQRLNPDAVAAANCDQILDNCRATETIREKMMPQLRTRDACRTVVDRLQYFAIRLHTSYVVSVCCRPALRRGESNKLEASQKQFLAEKCKENLTETVRMFLAMHQLSVIPTRSWAFTYHGLSSAVLLGILCETKADLEIRQLQGDLIAALSATAAKEQTSPPSHIRKSTRDIELSGPLSRALTALRNIYEHGSIVGSGVKIDKEGPGSGGRTPLSVNQLANLGPQASGSQDTQRIVAQLSAPQPVMDAHRSAALAMAEMQQQNGLGLQDFASGLAFAPQVSSVPQVGISLPDLSGIDPSTYMSPMDLYDSIFWESPDPWNTGLDAMNFDFSAQPPPGQREQQFYF